MAGILDLAAKAFREKLKKFKPVWICFNGKKAYKACSIIGLIEYYKNNSIELEEIREKISGARQLEYPQMKILDMAFWQLGFGSKWID